MINSSNVNSIERIMKKPRFLMGTGWRWLALGMALSMSFIPKPVMSADGIDPDADKILKSMSSYLAQTKGFRVNADIALDVVTDNGEKLQFTSSAKLVLERQNKFYLERKGAIAQSQFFFDGKTLTLYGKKRNAYAQIAVSGSIDDAIRAYESETGIPAPGADLMFANPYSILSTGIKSSSYLGTAYINGIECHHLAFRKDMVDWQIWIQTGDKALPMKYVITSKWQAAAPQYEIRFYNWEINPQIDNNQFRFVAPSGATKLNVLPARDMDEFTSTEEKK